MFSRPQRVQIRGQSVELTTHRRRGFWGFCNWNKAIEIHEDATGKEYLGTLIHEYQHQAQPDLSEDAVNEISDGLTDILYDVLKYRRLSEVEL